MRRVGGRYAGTSMVEHEPELADSRCSEMERITKAIEDASRQRNWPPEWVTYGLPDSCSRRKLEADGGAMF